MDTKIQVLGCLLLLLAGTLRGYGQVSDQKLTQNGLADNHYFNVNSAKVELEDALKQLESRYNVAFVYESGLLNGMQVVPNSRQSDSFGRNLQKLLAPFNLKYMNLNERTFIIKPAPEPSALEEKFIHQVQGVVTDAGTGDTMPGVNVVVKGTQIGAATDPDGEFSLNTPSPQDTLMFSFIGYQTKEVPIRGRNIVNVELVAEAVTSDEVVVVGFGEQEKTSVVSSISTINPTELQGTSNNLTNMMQGRVAGMISFQRSGEPGADNSEFFIRGLGTFGSGKQNPLILIDGIESSTTDMARLQPDDIASFSVLKDATASAVYGARGANGVVIIKTKSGQAGETRFKVRTETKVSTNTQNFQFADNITYMNLANEAALTRDPNAVLPYTRTKIQNTEAGNNPYLYPSNNWIDQLIKDYTVNQSYNLSASGGNKDVQYYVAGTYTVDNGVLKVDGENDFNNNIKLQNYSVRSNINLNLTSTTEAIIRVYGQFDNYSGPVGGGESIFNAAVWSNPVKFPAVYPSSMRPYLDHPMFGGAVTGRGSTSLLSNPYAEMVEGYQVWKTSNIQPQLELKQDLSGITEGLTARAMGYLKRYSRFDVSRQYNPFYYDGYRNPVSGDMQLRVLNDGGANSIGIPGTEYLNYSEGQKTLNSNMYMETAFNYKRTFLDKHAVSGMLLGLISSYQTGNAGSVQSSLPRRNMGISGRFTYGYDERYLAEFNFGYNGSERFAEDHRFGFFPSLGLAYRISNEDFFNPFNGTISELKLRASYGLIGNDAIGDVDDRFFYLSNVNLNDFTYSSTFGEEFDYSRPGVSISRYSNRNISWEKSEQYNVGFDLSLYESSLNFVVDVYRQYRTSILQPRTYLTESMGLMAIPSSNYGEAISQGVDFSMDFQKQFSQDWWSSMRANFTYATSEKTKADEINYPQDQAYRSEVGHSIAQRFGYIAERLFIDQSEVENSPTQFGTYMGGDIKYHDMNGDGVINQADMVPIGHPITPEIIYGFGGTIGYKDFDFSFFFQGSERTSFFINSGNISPFRIRFDEDYGRWYQHGLLETVAEDHWSEENRDPYAFFPRLSNTEIENNNQASTWWLRDGSFLRLKTLELGYTLPPDLTERFGIRNLRAYATGTNLAVWSNFKLWDPEMGGNGLGYPIQSVYSFGIELDL
ncbi:TonB-dependent receptor [Aliifodinibius sp. S!AR15-10]|uniref:SusC/RagA family TonB-linked outer membrane protein n=1 Tax=Aliifodinibius sp. S!AR15-10 TaxID=2950437 RepID=UPI0028636538|nr:TonB-dependent receptor [Aliifodinibius sp. S!AR15-10]MDR8392779.1 TonB-dependent receptor [Aliifodinibius sp. S!AR15-10]